MPTTHSRPTTKVPEIVRQLCGIVAELEQTFGRPFTLDGHLVGSLGEVMAADRYGLTLLPPSHEKYDAKATDGRLVQIKMTQGKAVALRSEPNHLIVLKLDENGGIDEVYNGPGDIAWKAAGKRQSNGQHRISVAKLRSLMNELPAESMLPATGSA